MLNQYYYLDWLAMTLSLLAVWLLGNKNRWGFAFFVMANITWLAVGSMAGSYGIVVGNMAFLIMNSRGFLRWKGAAKIDAQLVGALS